jgi:hypothetical protein
LFGQGRDRLTHAVLADQGEAGGQDEVDDGDDQRRHPHLHGGGQQRDDRGAQGQQADEAEQPAGSEHADPQTGLSALLGHLRLSQRQLLAHQGREVIREVLEQLSHRLLTPGELWVPDPRAGALSAGHAQTPSFMVRGATSGLPPGTGSIGWVPGTSVEFTSTTGSASAAAGLDAFWSRAA